MFHTMHKHANKEVHIVSLGILLLVACDKTSSFNVSVIESTKNNSLRGIKYYFCINEVLFLRLCLKHSFI